MFRSTLMIAASVLLGYCAPSVVNAADETPHLTFEVYQDKKMEYRWRLKAGNNKIIADSGEGYKAKADAMHGIELIKAGTAKSGLKVETSENAKKEYAWHLKGKNGKIIADSGETYKDKADAMHAIKLIEDGAADAKVVEAKTKE